MLDYSEIDKGIVKAVRILRDNGVDTFESCEGKGDGRYFGEEHCFPEPTIRFHGDAYECIRVLDMCKKSNLAVLGTRLCFERVDDILDKPFGEVVFLMHHKTGTIFRPD